MHAARPPAASQPRRYLPAWQQRPDEMPPAIWHGARLISALTNPMVLTFPCFAAVSWKASPHWRERLRWWAIACGALSLTPFIHLRWGVRTGRLSDHQVSRREERFWPYLGELGAIGASYGLMRALGAPRLMTATVVSVGIGIGTVTVVTLCWKISMHVTGTAGTAAVLVLVYGRKGLPAVLLVPAVGWSRHVLEHHTIAQTAAGAVVGALAPLAVFRALRLPGAQPGSTQDRPG